MIIGTPINRNYMGGKEIKEWKPFMDYHELMKLGFKDLTHGWWGAQGNGHWLEIERNGKRIEVSQGGWAEAYVMYDGEIYLFQNKEQLNEFCKDKLGFSFL